MHRTMSFFSMFLLLLAAHLTLESLAEQTQGTHTEIYDFIIVGAGTAGSALAARLCSSLPSSRILLLERGKPRDSSEELLVQQPRFAYDTWEVPTLTETFESQNDPTLGNRTLAILTARTVGGTSAINGGQMTLPSSHIIPSWKFARLSAERVKTLLTRILKTLHVAPPTPDLVHEYFNYWFDAARRADYKLITDPFDKPAGDVVFTNHVAVSAEQNKRVDSYTGYVKPLIENKCKHSLTVRLDAQVTKIHFANAGCNARNVKYKCAKDLRYLTSDGTKVDVRARKEIILSAGPFGSPQLLQLSGIGPRDVLKRFGIAPIRQLPVGQLAQSRALFVVNSLYTRFPLARTNNGSVLGSEEALRQWRDGKGGPLALSIAAINGRVDTAAEMTGNTVWFESSGLLNVPVITTTCVGNRGEGSYATVEIGGRDVSDGVKVQLNMYGMEENLANMATCARKIRKIHKHLKESMGAQEILPEGLTEDMLEDEGVLREYVRAATQNGLHFVGGARVGQVVDARFAVRGVHGLRVVDASVIPQVPESAGPMASVYVLAEHAADIIRYKYRTEFK